MPSSPTSASRPLTSPQLSTLEPLSQIWLTCSTVMHSTGFSGLTTTESASLATWTSSKAIPFDLQAAISSSSIGRDASEMSVSPAQNFSKPPPVPEVPTVTLTQGCSAWKSSAAASDRGATVLEPSMRIVPERSPPQPLVSSSSPQAPTPSARTDTQATIVSHLELVTLSPSRFFRLSGRADGRPRRPPSQRLCDSLLPACIAGVKKV